MLLWTILQGDEEDDFKEEFEQYFFNLNTMEQKGGGNH